MEIFADYQLTIFALGTLAVLMLVQLLAADVLGIQAKHKPGTPVAADHSNSLFRASRVVGNANESIAIFILAVAFCIMSGASPSYTAYAAWAYVVARFVYAGCYYGNMQTLRSTIFGVSLLALVALLVIGFFF